jgi:hypothetical protein
MLQKPSLINFTSIYMPHISVSLTLQQIFIPGGLLLENNFPKKQVRLL